LDSWFANVLLLRDYHGGKWEIHLSCEAQAFSSGGTGTEMIEVLQNEGVNVVANSGHPGAVKTPLGKNFFEKGTTGKISLLQVLNCLY
jgi:hypothetical protein